MSTSPTLDADALLAQMAADGQSGSGDLVIDGVQVRHHGQKVPKMRYSHKAMADLIIATPGISQNDLAAHFGYTPAWVSTVITSDAFQALLEQRREEMVDPELRLTLQERFQGLAAQSLRVLQEKLTRPTHEISDNLALKAAELGAKALGLGGHAPPQPAPESSADRLARLAERLIALRQTPTSEILDVQARQVD